MTARLPQTLRADAQDNRDRVVEAARDLFADRGLTVTMREVARRAGVGPATLYRRFPTRRDLIDAAFDTELRACRAIVEDGWADADPVRGLGTVIEGIGNLHARNRGFVAAFLAEGGADGALAAHRAELQRMLDDLASRAQRSGALRDDFRIGDLLLVLAAGRALSTLPVSTRDAAARRFAALALDALRAPEVRTVPRPESRLSGP